MIPSPRSWTTVGFSLLLAALASPSVLIAQAVCPSASAPDAEEGWAAYQDGDMAVARTLFQRALETCDNDEYARTGLGYVELRDGFVEEAEAAFARVVDVEPNNIDALVGLGLAAWRTGDLDAVRGYFGRVRALEPDNPTAADFLGRLEGQAGAPPPSSDPADRAWAEGDLDLAFELYSARLDRDATDGLALLRVGQMRSWREQYDAALELLDLLVDLEPGNTDAILARARVYAWTGDVPRALAEVDRVLEVIPDNPEALTARALFQVWAGRSDEAMATYGALISINPEHDAGRRQLAQAAVAVAENDAAIAAYGGLVVDDPSDVDARLGYAGALAVGGRYEESLAQYAEILRRDPRDGRALVGRARTHLWAGRLVEAERAALAALEVDDASGAAWLALGQTYRAQGRAAAALDALVTAEGFAPGNAEIRDQLRAVRLGLAPDVRPTVIAEDDSDGNRMVTTSLDGSWHPAPRVEVSARGYYKDLEQVTSTFAIARRAYGGTVTGTYQMWPGWKLSGGLGGSVTNGDGTPTFLSFSAGVRTPDRHAAGLSLDVMSQGLDETALLAERGVRASSVTLTGRWFPDNRWRLDGSFSIGSYEGSQSNGRRGWFAGVSRRMGSGISLGVSHRGFSFEKNVNDGYFDPDFYGIVELTSYWLYRPSAWSFLVELAPGAEQITTDGDPRASLRGNARVGYRIGQARELSVSYGYSTAGLTSFATGATDYRYMALIVGVTWGL